MATMKKSSIIWGDKRSVTLAQFKDSDLQAIEKEVRLYIGPRATFNKAAAKQAIAKAKNNPKMKNAYVKVGLVGTSMVLRAKEKKFFGDVEEDAELVTNFKQKTDAFRQEMMNEFSSEYQRNVKELQKLKDEQERQKRLKEVMNRKDNEGVSLRDKILRAAKMAQKLGIGNYAQEKLKLEGLTPMDPGYHGEVIDKQNRYARYLGPLKKVWDDKASKTISFSAWLDKVEAGDESVPGVKEARAITSEELGGKTIVTKDGITGGKVIYLDDQARKPYVATANKGKLTGGTVKNGALIFVIGPDNKLYVGDKARSAPGKREAFNHSSFFSGGPVRSAGTMVVKGGTVAEIHDLSGHYAPTRKMVEDAVKFIGGGDVEWLKTVEVVVSGKKAKGTEFMGIQPDVPKTQSPSTKPSLKRTGSTGSLRTGEDFVPIITKPVSGGAMMGDINRQNQRKAKTTQRTGKTRTKEQEQREKESEEATPLAPQNAELLRQSPAFHGNLDRVTAEQRLGGKAGNWLLRVGSNGSFVFSEITKESKPNHAEITTNKQFAQIQRISRSRQAGLVRP